jgi:hypothetical protein
MGAFPIRPRRRSRPRESESDVHARTSVFAIKRQSRTGFANFRVFIENIENTHVDFTLKSGTEPLEFISALMITFFFTQ